VVLEAAKLLSKTEMNPTLAKRSPEPDVGDDRNKDCTAQSPGAQPRPSFSAFLLRRILSSAAIPKKIVFQLLALSPIMRCSWRWGQVKVKGGRRRVQKFGRMTWPMVYCRIATGEA
jgi:hypothetical protein